MAFLILGIAIWWAAHRVKRLRSEWVANLAEGPRKLGVTVALLLSVVLMVIGYRAADYIHVWSPPAFMVHINNLAMIVALYFTSPGPKKGALFHKLRHPQLAGFKLWAFVHLLVNGDLASIILFGSMLIWAVVTMIIINKSEPDWQPGPKGTIAKDAMFFVASIVLLGGIGYIHGLIGPSPFPG